MADRVADRGQGLKGHKYRKAFKRAIWQLAGGRPTRGQLKDIGARAAKIAGHFPPWGGAHLYTLVNWERWPKYGIAPALYRAVMRLAGRPAMVGARPVMVLAGPGVKLRAGAVILAPSKLCGRRACGVYFVGGAANRVYCSAACKQAGRKFHPVPARRHRPKGKTGKGRK